MLIHDARGEEHFLSDRVHDARAFGNAISQILGQPLSNKTVVLLQGYVADFYMLNRAKMGAVCGKIAIGWHKGTYFLPSRLHESVLWLDRRVRDTYTRKGDQTKQEAFLKELLAMKAGVIAVIYLAATLMQPLAVKNFVVNVTGKTRGGKTTATAAATTLFGDPDLQMCSWDVTSTGAEIHAGMTTDYCTWFDDT
ncbi:MAG: DUF927 domain-containing protein [Syntrophorhabdales bacterium]